MRWLILLLALGSPKAFAARAPNIVIILADDLGYGDLGVYGHPSIRTPHLDQLAGQGLRFTDFYSGAEVCTPSRAALLTGRYPLRSGMSTPRRVLFPDSKGGLPPAEVTMAELLKTRGYATAHVGKWHLGIHPGSRPLDQGFDFSFGLPYSNDMDVRTNPPAGPSGSPDPPEDGWLVPLIRNGEVIERPAKQSTLTLRYTDEAVRFIREHRRQPFFLYFAHTFPHVPLFASPAHQGRSRRGLYGDVVEELDASVGRIVAALRAARLEKNTLVFFTSDNGPWLVMREQGGSAGPLREGKGSTWEGGQRVPAIAWWPGRIRPGITSEPASVLDLLPTVAALARAEAPSDRLLDGQDLTPLLWKGQTLPPRPFFFYRGAQLTAVRLGDWKAHWVTQNGYGQSQPQFHEPPLLFHLARDPAERFNVAESHPEVLGELRRHAQIHQETMVPGEPQLQ